MIDRAVFERHRNNTSGAGAVRSSEGARGPLNQAPSILDTSSRDEVSRPCCPPATILKSTSRDDVIAIMSPTPAGVRLNAIARRFARASEANPVVGAVSPADAAPHHAPTHDLPMRRALPRVFRFGASSGGVQGAPVRSSMYRRMSRRTTWEGVASSSAHKRSKKAFLRGSMRTVSRAVRSSRATAVL
jgi:hypothetical protein